MTTLENIQTVFTSEIIESVNMRGYEGWLYRLYSTLYDDQEAYYSWVAHNMASFMQGVNAVEPVRVMSALCILPQHKIFENYLEFHVFNETYLQHASGHLHDMILDRMNQGFDSLLDAFKSYLNNDARTIYTDFIVHSAGYIFKDYDEPHLIREGDEQLLNAKIEHLKIFYLKYSAGAFPMLDSHNGIFLPITRRFDRDQEPFKIYSKEDKCLQKIVIDTTIEKVEQKLKDHKQVKSTAMIADFIKFCESRGTKITDQNKDYLMNVVEMFESTPLNEFYKTIRGQKDGITVLNQQYMVFQHICDKGGINREY